MEQCALHSTDALWSSRGCFLTGAVDPFINEDAEAQGLTDAKRTKPEQHPSSQSCQCHGLM